MQSGKANQIAISNQGLFLLQSPHDFGESLSLLQEIEIQRGEDILSMIAQVEISPSQVNIVGLTPMGTRLFTIQWDNKKFHFSSLSPEGVSFEAKRILADIQILLWPRILLGSGVEVKESSKEPYYRDIYVEGEKVIHVQYDSEKRGKGKSVLSHIEQGYEIRVTTIQIESL